jgi:hypothetical protein
VEVTLLFSQCGPAAGTAEARIAVQPLSILIRAKNTPVLKRAIATDLLPAVDAVLAGQRYVSPDC